MCTKDLTWDSQTGFRGHIVLIEPKVTNNLVNELRLREVIRIIAYPIDVDPKKVREVTLFSYVEAG
jgi:hypothetical protein